MVNVNNYGVQGTNYTTGTNNQKNVQGQQPGTSSVNQGNRPKDSYSNNTMPSGKIPSVGAWDKMSAYFKDVMSTPQNLVKYKTFETAIKNNPEGYLQPGSNDMGKVKDLQKKLNYLGMNITVNGQFGGATEQAIIRFKNSVGINDGFMDKSGKMAVTPIVTPQTWSLLNAQVANKMNPNTNVTGGSYVTPVTNEELNWAKNLAGKIQQYGYKPSENERQRYENIFNRQKQSNQPIQTSQPVNPPTAHEMQWAKNLAAKIQQYGYRPNAQEAAQYQDIFGRNKATQQNKNVQSQQNQNGGVSPAEMQWATNMMNKVKGGYKPTPDEEIKYQEIYSRTKSQNTGAQTQGTQTTNNAQPVSQQELSWAKNLETRVSQGYNPTPQERAKYDDIYNRSQNVQTNQQTTQANQNSGGVTEQEMAWAKAFEDKVNNQGYKPSQQEMQIYSDIYNRSQNQGTQSTQTNQNTASVEKPTQQEIDWAVNLENKVKGGYKPTQNELAIYNDIATKLNAYNNSQAGAGNTNDNSQVGAVTGNNPLPPPRDNGNSQVDDSPSAQNNSVSEEFSYSQATINAFKSAFPGVTFKGGSVPYLPANVANQVAKQYGFTSVSELQSAVGAGVDGKFGPETFFRLSQAKNGNQASAPTSTNSTQNAGGNQNGVTQTELNWAVQLQDKFSQGYKPTDQEQAKYTDIFNRYNASGQNVVADNAGGGTSNVGSTSPTTQSSGAPTQEEVDWAANLQQRVGTGYQPNQQEVAKYTDIFNRYNGNGNQVSGSGGNQFQPQSTQQYSVDPSIPTVGVNANGNDPELQWALQLLDRVQQQGYQPSNDEVTKYEQIIARNKSTMAAP